jgi:hypothetical protein
MPIFGASGKEERDHKSAFPPKDTKFRGKSITTEISDMLSFSLIIAVLKTVQDFLSGSIGHMFGEQKTCWIVLFSIFS